MAIILAIIFVFDTLEILRRLNENDVTIFVVMSMGLLKLPEVGQLILPFGVLFSAMFTFWQLNRRQELVILRSTGLSVWQFLLPIMAVAIMLGVVQIVLMNPVGSVLLTKYERFEADFLSQDNNLVASLSDGLWLKQTQNNEEMIIRSGRIDPREWEFYNISIYRFDEQNRFQGRVDSKKAKLTPDGWYFDKAVIHHSSKKTKYVSDFLLPTSLSPQDIENSFASPESKSFWELPYVIYELQAAGFDTTKLRIHFHSLLSLPLLFAAMVCVAAIISLKPTLRSGGTLKMVIAGILLGFIIFFTTNFCKALGASHQMPVLIAAWSPACITFILSLGILMNTEDG